MESGNSRKVMGKEYLEPATKDNGKRLFGISRTIRLARMFTKEDKRDALTEMDTASDMSPVFATLRLNAMCR